MAVFLICQLTPLSYKFYPGN